MVRCASNLDYVQVFDNNDLSNTLKALSTGAIALTPTGNTKGNYFIMSLASSNRISRHSWIPLPMTDSNIARVHALALANRKPLIQTSSLIVEWQPDHPINPTDYDHDFITGVWESKQLLVEANED
jgi:hypothetical protein